MRSAAILALGLGVGLGVAATARAEPDVTTPAAAGDGGTLAQSLFDRAREHMDAGEFELACPLLAESQRLDPGGGTLLNLAVCYEKAKRLASAYVTYNEALSQAIRDGRDDRKQIATDALAEIAPRLSKIAVEVPAGARQAGLVVRLDGQEIPPAAWGTGTPVDGGAHRVEAIAPGHFDFVETLELAPEADRRTVTVSALVPRPTYGAGGLAAIVPAQPPAQGGPTCPAGATLREGMCIRPGEYRALIGTSLALGGVAVAIGIGTGIAAVAMSSSLDEKCTADGLCPPEEESDVSTYDGVSTTSTIAFMTGGALIGLGALLWITHPAEETLPLGATIAPRADGAVLGLAGRF